MLILKDIRIANADGRDGRFEVRSDELRDWGIKNGDFIIIDNWDFNSKYK